MPNIYIVFKNEKETGIVYVKDLYFLLRNLKQIIVQFTNTMSAC